MEEGVYILVCEKDNIILMGRFDSFNFILID